MSLYDPIRTIGLFATAGAGAKPAWQLAILLQAYGLLMHLLQQLHPFILEDLLYLSAHCSQTNRLKVSASIYDLCNIQKENMIIYSDLFISIHHSALEKELVILCLL